MKTSGATDASIRRWLDEEHKFEVSRATFSRFKKKSKTKKKKSHRKKEEEDDDEEGYDIFDIEIEPKKKAKPVVPESKESADKKPQAAEKAAERPASIEEMAAKVLEEAFSVEQEEEPAAAAYDRCNGIHSRYSNDRTLALALTRSVCGRYSNVLRYRQDRWRLCPSLHPSADSRW